MYLGISKLFRSNMWINSFHHIFTRTNDAEQFTEIFDIDIKKDFGQAF